MRPWLPAQPGIAPLRSDGQSVHQSSDRTVPQDRSGDLRVREQSKKYLPLPLATVCAVGSAGEEGTRAPRGFRSRGAEVRDSHSCKKPQVCAAGAILQACVSHQSLVLLGLSPPAGGLWVAAGLRQGRPPGPDVLGISSGSFPAGLRLTSGPIHHH